jgi:uncharacterized protein
VNRVDPPTDLWIDEHLVVRDSSISGRGLFAAAPIEQGRVVIRLGGRLVATAELGDLLLTSPLYVDTLTIYEDVHLVLPPGTKVHFGNHSCDPNLWHTGPYEIAARRSIEVGEEVTVDYGTQSGAPGFSMACTCTAPICRVVITSDDWRLPNLQDTYAGHWVPALEERIS